jgi:hypothetical protein
MAKKTTPTGKSSALPTKPVPNVGGNAAMGGAKVGGKKGK